MGKWESCTTHNDKLEKVEREFFKSCGELIVLVEVVDSCTNDRLVRYNELATQQTIHIRGRCCLFTTLPQFLDDIILLEMKFPPTFRGLVKPHYFFGSFIFSFHF